MRSTLHVHPGFPPVLCRDGECDVMVASRTARAYRRAVVATAAALPLLAAAATASAHAAQIVDVLGAAACAGFFAQLVVVQLSGGGDRSLEG